MLLVRQGWRKDEELTNQRIDRRTDKHKETDRERERERERERKWIDMHTGE